MIVLADADLEKSVEGAVQACFSNSGRLCISVERMYVDDAVYDRRRRQGRPGAGRRQAPVPTSTPCSTSRPCWRA